jgi:putative transposase
MSLIQPPHRKQVKHYDDPGHCRELTFSCYRRRSLLTNHLWRGMLSEAIDRANERHDYHLTAFVYMPEHVHLLVYPGPDASRIELLLTAIKRPFSFRIKKLLIESKSPLLKRLTIRQRPGVETFRFWQEGPGYDRNLDNPDTTLAAIDYIHLNPVRRGLVSRATDWQWSSARWYEGLPYDEQIRAPKLARLPAEFLVQATR